MCAWWVMAGLTLPSCRKQGKICCRSGLFRRRRACQSEASKARLLQVEEACLYWACLPLAKVSLRLMVSALTAPIMTAGISTIAKLSDSSNQDDDEVVYKPRQNKALQ